MKVKSKLHILTWGLSLIGLSILILGSGCGDNVNNRPSSIIMGTFSKALGNLPYHVAKFNKWFEADQGLKGIEIKYTEFNDRPSISQAFDSRALQVLYSGDVPVILCRAQGNDIRTIDVSAVAAQEILVHSDSDILTVQELRGKRIAVLQGTTSHYCLLKILRQNGLKPTDVNLVYMSPAEARAAFESSQIDAWAVWAPWVEPQELSGEGRVLKGSDAVINSIMTIPNYLAENHPEICGTLVTITQRAKQWIVQYPDSAQKIAASELGLDSSVVALAFTKFDWTALLSEGTIEDLQQKSDFLAAEDKTRLSAAVDVRGSLIDTRFLK